MRISAVQSRVLRRCANSHQPMTRFVLPRYVRCDWNNCDSIIENDEILNYFPVKQDEFSYVYIPSTLLDGNVIFFTCSTFVFNVTRSFLELDACFLGVSRWQLEGDLSVHQLFRTRKKKQGRTISRKLTLIQCTYSNQLRPSGNGDGC